MISIGLSGQELVDKLNEVIAAVNDMRNVESYGDMSDKPQINGVTVNGSLSFADLGMTMEHIPGYEDLTAEMLTSEDVETITLDAVTAAEQAVGVDLAGKMDKDIRPYDQLLNNINGSELIAVVKEGVAYKMTLKTLMQIAYSYYKSQDGTDTLQVITSDDSPAFINNNSYWFDVEQ